MTLTIASMIQATPEAEGERVLVDMLQNTYIVVYEWRPRHPFTSPIYSIDLYCRFDCGATVQLTSLLSAGSFPARQLSDLESGLVGSRNVQVSTTILPGSHAVNI
jgi:hypothetical protein